MRTRSRAALVVAFTLLLALPSAAAVAKGGPNGGGGGGPKKPTVQFKSGSYSYSENITNPTIAITVSTKVTGSVKVKTGGGTATGGSSCGAGVDYIEVPESSSSTVNFVNSAQNNWTGLVICNDTVFEPNETILLQLYGPSDNLSLGSKQTATYTIQNNDAAPLFSVNDQTGDEGTALNFVVTSSLSSLAPMSVDWTTAPTGASPTENGDFSPTTGTVAFAPGQTTATIPIDLTDDAVDEDTETFLVLLSNPQGGNVSDGTGLGTINDLDDPPVVDIAGATPVSEGDTAEFPVTLSAPSEKTVTVVAGAEDADGLLGVFTDAPDDHGTTTETLTFLPGETATTLSVPTNDDSDVELDEFLPAAISSPVNATLGTASANGGITDNEIGKLDLEPESGYRNGTTGTVVATVTNKSGSVFFDNVLVRFELYNSAGSDVSDFSRVPIGGPGDAGFDFTNDDADVYSQPVSEGPGQATFTFTDPGGYAAPVIACVVTTVQATPDCGLTTLLPDDGDGEDYQINSDAPDDDLIDAVFG